MSNLAMYYIRLSQDSAARLTAEELEIVERERADLSRSSSRLDLALRSVGELLQRVDDQGLDKGECINLSELVHHLAESIYECNESTAVAADIVATNLAR
jgi:hypothetical protein